MAERIALVPCINPKHQDSTPSMAVYDHGQAKLQVFCFGCKYHGWVTPDQVVIPKPPPLLSWGTGIGAAVPPTSGVALDMLVVKEMVTNFFKRRNIDTVPWGLIEYGSKIKHNQIRPAFWYNLLNVNGNVIGEQTRFLDDLKPKVSLENTCGEHPKYAWHRPDLLKDGHSSIRVVESWIDAVHRNKGMAVHRPTLILLGTQYNKVDWYKIKTEIVGDNCVHLWFDGDTAGIECANNLYHVLDMLGVSVFNYTVPGKKVYEHTQL